MKKLIILMVINWASVVLCSTSQEQTESRKTSVRSPVPVTIGTSALVNSLQSSQDNVGKPQSVQSQAFTRQPTAQEYNASPQSSVYTHVQGSGVTGQPTTPTGGYLITVNSQGGQQLSTLSPTYSSTNGPTPVIMQYLPQNGQQGGIQYLQLIPTRPLIVPVSPYISPYNQYNPQVNHYNSATQYSPQLSAYSPQPNQYSPQVSAYSGQSSPFSPQSSPFSPQTSQYSPQSSQYSPQSSQYSPQVNSYSPHTNSQHTLATAASTYSSIPSNGYHSPTTHHNYASYQPTLQSPLGGFSTNVYSYFRPNSGVQMISGPMDLSLNTNEYLPLQGENGYKMRRP